jgi:hypothetical protein
VAPERIASSASAEAREVFDRLMRTYGAREAFRRSYVDGFWTGLERLRRDPSVFARGEARGESEARAAAEDEGRRAALERALSEANTEARARFEVVVQNPSALVDVTVRVPDVSFAPFQARPPFDLDLESELRALESRFGLNPSWSQNGLTISLSDSRDRFDLREVYALGGAGRYRFNESWTRSDWAFSGWERNLFGLSFNQDLFRDLSPSQRRDFEEGFRRSFERLAQENRQWTQRVYNAEDRGDQAGAALGETFAFHEGRVRGYLEGYER